MGTWFGLLPESKSPRRHFFDLRKRLLPLTLKVLLFLGSQLYAFSSDMYICPAPRVGGLFFIALGF